MSFAFPNFLWALPAIILPIIIHLLQRQRHQKVEFGAMMFINKALKRNKNLILLQDLILLILRTATILFLILYLAQPFTNSNNNQSFQKPSLKIIVIDTSMSMAQFSMQDQLIELAKKQARDLLVKNSTDKDSIAVIQAGHRAKIAALGPRKEATQIIEKEINQEFTSTDWNGCMATISELIQQNEYRINQTEIFLFSDFQDEIWSSESILGEKINLLQDRGVKINFIPLKIEQASNLAVENSALSKNRVVRGEQITFSTNIHNYSETTKKTNISIQIDGQEVYEDDIEIEARGTRNIQHDFSLNTTGVRYIKAVIDQDDLLLDNQQSLKFEVAPALNVNICTQEDLERGDQYLSVVYSYLNLGSDTPIQCNYFPPSEIEKSVLDDSDVLILGDINKISNTKKNILIDHIRGGGGLLAIIGPNADNDTYTTILKSLGVNDFSIGAMKQGDYLLKIENELHPSIQLFRDSKWKNLLTEVPHRKYRQFQTDPKQTTLSFIDRKTGTQDIACAHYDFESFNVAILSAVPFGLFNRMPEVPGGSLTFIYDLLFSISPDSNVRSFIPIDSVTSLMTNGEKPKLGLCKINDIMTPVHAIPKESDLRFNDPNFLINKSAEAINPPSSEQESNNSSKSSSLGYVFLWMALATLLAEIMLALITDRRRII